MKQHIPPFVLYPPVSYKVLALEGVLASEKKQDQVSHPNHYKELMYDTHTFGEISKPYGLCQYWKVQDYDVLAIYKGTDNKITARYTIPNPKQDIELKFIIFEFAIDLDSGTATIKSFYKKSVTSISKRINVQEWNDLTRTSELSVEDINLIEMMTKIQKSAETPEQTFPFSSDIPVIQETRPKNFYPGTFY